MKLEPVTRSSLVDTVVERLGGVLNGGQFKAGDRLPSELELVQQLGVSRPVLREAVCRLEGLGLLIVRRGQGMFVGDGSSFNGCLKLLQSAMAVSPRDLMQFTELRRAIECYTARRAAELAGPDDLAELETLCNQMYQEGQDYAEAIQIDFRFHQKLVEITRNELIANVMSVIQELIMASMVQTFLRCDRARGRREHRALLRAIRGGDADSAERAMRAHMDLAARLLRQQLEDEERRPVSAGRPSRAKKGV